MKSSYAFLREAWKKTAPHKAKAKKWVKDDVVEKIEKPTRVDRARALGYKAKQGYVLARTRIKKGGRRRPTIRKGRRPKRAGRVHFTAEQSLQAIAEKRASRKYPNLEVLNSYPVGEDGKNKYYEIILVDPSHAVIKKDKKISWITGQRRRVFRGLTSAARKSRGL